MTGQRILAAHHEAGHAVAAVMRGGSTLTSVTLSARHGEGITWASHKPPDLAFFAWAGPWAEARHQWDSDDPAGEDDDGATLDDYVSGALLTQPGDMAVVVAEEDALTERLGADLARTLIAGTYRTWQRELERVRPAVQQVAARLAAGESVTDAQVRALTGD